MSEAATIVPGPVQVIREHIEIVQGVTGPKARIIGRRLRVQDIADWHERDGMSVDEILEQFSPLTRGDVYTALAYYWDHKEEIETQIASDEAMIDANRRDNPGQLQDRIEQMTRDGRRLPTG